MTVSTNAVVTGESNISAIVNPVTGRITISTGNGTTPIPEIAGLVSSDSAQAAANSTALQAALSGGGDCTIAAQGTLHINETMLLPSGTRLRLSSGLTLALTGTYGRTMLRNANACASGNLTIGACFVICADSETPSGAGAIRSIAAPARLYYTAPDDTEGAAVDVSAADGKYTLTSANGQRLYVSVARSYLNAGVSQAVRVLSACDGAASATWSRDTATLTITEAGHNRRAGDAVTIFGATILGLYYINAVSGSTWSVADTRGAGSGACRVFGSRGIEISVDNGALIDYAQTGKTVAQSCDTHAIIINSASKTTTPGLRVANARKYAFYATHVAGLDSQQVETPASISDGWHVNGPARNVSLRGMSGANGDNLTALGNSDFAPYVINWSGEYGGGDIDGASISDVTGNNNHTELCRIYSTTGRVFKNIVLRNFTGTVDATTTAVIALSTDTVTPVENAVELNIDGLTIERVNVRRSDGGEIRIFADVSAAAASAGKRKNVVLRDLVLPDPMGDAANPIVTGRGVVGAIQVLGNYDGLRVERVRAPLNLANGHAQWKGTVVSAGNGAVIKALVVDDVKFANNNTLLPTAAFSAIVKVDPGATVTSLLIQNVDTYEVNGTGTKAVLLYANGGTTTNVTLRDVANLDGDSIARIGASGTVTSLSIDGAYANSSTTYCVAADKSVPSITYSNIRGQFNSLLNTAAGSGTIKVRGSGITAALASGAGQFNGTYTGMTLDVSGPEFVIDLANVALSRTANKGNIVKAKAIAGTIPAGVLAVCDDSGATSSWKAIHNTILVY